MIRAIIVDDEQLSMMYLESKLMQFPNIQIIRKYMSAESVFQDLSNYEIDVAFLDIELGSASGINLAEELLASNPRLHIVFVSAHPQYAVKAFELDSVDYLLKPVMPSRLEKTIERIRTKLHKQREQAEEQTEDTLVIRSFREFSVHFSNKPLTFKTKKARELFAFLLSQHRLSIHRDLIIDSLWHDHDYKRAKTYLHTCLSHLRRALAETGCIDAITFQDECYTLQLCSFIYDAKQLKDTHARMEAGQADLHELEFAAKLYKGRYLEMNDYPWIQSHADELHEKFMAILDELVRQHIVHSPSKALACLQIQHQFNPYSDSVIKKTMQILLQTGQRPEALELYEKHAELLDQDLGISPAKELLDMYISVK